MIVRKEADEIVYIENGRVLFRVKLPPGGVTVAELEGFIEHLKKEVKEREAGPN